MCPLNNQHAAAANSNSKQQQKAMISSCLITSFLGSKRCKAMDGWMTKGDLAAFAEARERVKKMWSHTKSAKRVTKKEQPQSRKTKKVTQSRKTKRVTTAAAESAREAQKAKWKAETKRGIAAVAEAAKKAMKAKAKSMKTKRGITAATTASKDRMSERPRWRAGLLQRPGSAGDQVHEDNEGGDGADSDEVVAEAAKKAVKAKAKSMKKKRGMTAVAETAKEALKAKWKAETKRGIAAVARRTGLVAPAPRVYWRFGVRHSEY